MVRARVRVRVRDGVKVRPHVVMRLTLRTEGSARGQRDLVGVRVRVKVGG